MEVKFPVPGPTSNTVLFFISVMSTIFLEHFDLLKSFDLSFFCLDHFLVSKKVIALIKLDLIIFSNHFFIRAMIREILKNGRPKVILIASYSNKVFMGVNTWS